MKILLCWQRQLPTFELVSGSARAGANCCAVQRTFFFVDGPMLMKMTTLALSLMAALPAAQAYEPDAKAASATVSTDVHQTMLPAVSERDTNAKMEVRGFRVKGVAEHPQQRITAASVQAIADAHFAQLAAGESSVALDFAQLQAAADVITTAYRQAGFLVSVAFLPVQTVAADRIIEIQVMEGRIGKVIVQGNQRYQERTLSDSAERMRGLPLRRSDIDSALLYARDLPGVSVSSVLQPGENEGETDLVLVASEAARGWAVNLSVDNFGTETSGRGRVQAGLVWNNPLGRGDVFAISGNWQFSPTSSRNGAFSYSMPIRGVSGLSVLAGANQSELEVNTGPMAVLAIKGPASQRYLGSDWKFLNTVPLQMTASARLVRESSRFEAIGMALSNHRYDVAELGIGLRQNDTRWRGVNLAQLSVRRSLRDNSAALDVVNPYRDSQFTVARLGLMRMQYLTRDQRLVAKFNGQYTRNGLPAMEQFQLGGYDSIRGYSQGETLGDRGYLLGLEYQVDAPGFADRMSPFQGLVWRELLTFDVFADHGRVADATGHLAPTRLSSAGAGVTFRLPRFHGMEVRLAGALPTSSADASDGRDARAYARLSMNF